MSSEAPTFQTIIDLAIRGEDDDWAQIDKFLPSMSNSEEVSMWAKYNLKNPNYGLQDLAASILELTHTNLEDTVVEGLFELLSEENKENPYPSFRATCALAKRIHDPRIAKYKEIIRTKLQLFIDDEDVSQIARYYLANL